MTSIARVFIYRIVQILNDRKLNSEILFQECFLLYPKFSTAENYPLYGMCRYITSSRGHELSGHVRAHAYNYYAWAECEWVAK